MGGGDTALKRLDLIQTRAIRIIGHSEGIQLQSLAHRRGVAALTVFHRLVNHRAPQPLLSLIPPAAQSRRSSARSSNPPVLHPPDIRKPRFWLHSCIPLLTDIWNRLPSTTRDISDQQPFKQHINSTIDLTFLV